LLIFLLPHALDYRKIRLTKLDRLATSNSGSETVETRSRKRQLNNVRQTGKKLFLPTFWRYHAMWTKPEYTEMRFGFEVTMYIANR